MQAEGAARAGGCGQAHARVRSMQGSGQSPQRRGQLGTGRHATLGAGLWPGGTALPPPPLPRAQGAARLLACSRCTSSGMAPASTMALRLGLLRYARFHSAAEHGKGKPEQ